ncbi:hypothetical protein BJ322DRAFT_255249 [Thelephora terrestris]|uniref:F-box domain-containing protein n=1 Tax=Thelephora terrestris TaxID=56493 RepID=A0A9P6L3K8_9AGAM|nr:hypothetical protein BJ322DRAFT_255249 [Thelephora terrestris]
MDPAFRLTDIRLLQHVGARLTLEASHFSAGHEPPISMVKSLERDVATTLAMLRRRINACEPSVYRLHPELLSLAASHLSNKDLVTASQVSHRWRTTLLSFPRLWSDIDHVWGKRALTFLERSKSTPINLSMSINPPERANADDFLNRHAKRIETLTICVIPIRDPILLPLMPSLRKLDLAWCGTGIRSLHGTDGFIHPTVTTLIVRGGYAFPFNVPRLTRLQIHSPYSTLATTALLGFLNGCPSLEELEVDYDEQFEIERDLDAIDLPRLRFYSHSTSTDLQLDLIDKLSFPRSCSVVFNYWNGTTESNEFNDLLPFYNPSPLADIKRVKLKTDDSDSTIELIDAKSSRVYLVVDVQMSWQIHRIDEGITASYISYLEGINIHAVEVLCVEGPDIWDHDHAKYVLSCLQKITTLVLSNPAAIAYILALGQEPVDNDGDDDTNEWRCPMLGTLVIHAWEFSVRGEQILQHLPQVAQKRKDAGMPFESVSLFIRCPWDEHETVPMESSPALEQLRGCVEKFEIVTGDDALDWNMDDYFFDGLDVRRDRHLFPEQRRKLGFAR